MRIQKVIFLLILACIPLSGMAQANNSRSKSRKDKVTTGEGRTGKDTRPSTDKRKDTPKPVPKPKLSAPDGSISGHGYVNLGLPSGLKWATCNVGASSPSDYGNYYAWGETSTKSSYTEENSTTYGKELGDIGGSSFYDAARANWGGSWRLPTKAEYEELLNRCSWTWTSQGGHNGYLVKGPNGRSIFLPAAGWRYGTSLYDAGEYGTFWSYTPYEGNSNYAYILYFFSGYRSTDWFSRYFGRTVRAVSE